MIQMNVLTKQTHRHRTQTMITKGERWEGGINWKLEIDRYTLLYLK